VTDIVDVAVQARIRQLAALSPAQRDSILFVLCGATVDKAVADLLGPVPHPSDSRLRGRHRRAS
jgi:hypothetical protein